MLTELEIRERSKRIFADFEGLSLLDALDVINFVQFSYVRQIALITKEYEATLQIFEMVLTQSAKVLAEDLKRHEAETLQ